MEQWGTYQTLERRGFPLSDCLARHYMQHRLKVPHDPIQEVLIHALTYILWESCETFQFFHLTLDGREGSRCYTLAMAVNCWFLNSVPL